MQDLPFLLVQQGRSLSDRTEDHRMDTAPGRLANRGAGMDFFRRTQQDSLFCRGVRATQRLLDFFCTQELLVKDEKVAKMICGVRNRLLFQLRRNVSYKLQQNWGQNVLLYIHVKTLKQNSS